MTDVVATRSRSGHDPTTLRARSCSANQLLAFHLSDVSPAIAASRLDRRLATRAAPRSSPSSKRTPTATARAKSASRWTRGRRDARVRRHRGRHRPPPRRRPHPDSRLRRSRHQRSGRRFRYDLTPTISTPAAARTAPPRAAAAGVRPESAGVRPSAPLSPEDRHRMNRLGFRHDNLRADAAGDRKKRAPGHPRRLHPLRDRGRARASRIQRAARAVRTGARPLPVARHPPRYRHAANSAALLRDERVWSGFVRPACSSMASSRRRSRRRSRCDLPCHSTAVSCT